MTENLKRWQVWHETEATGEATLVASFDTQREAEFTATYGIDDSFTDGFISVLDSETGKSY